MNRTNPRTQQAPAPSDGRRFTLAEADRSLVLVRRIVRDVVGCYREVLDWQEALDGCQAKGSPEQTQRAQRELYERVSRLQGYADELAAMGLELKDWALGMVDFPAELEGRRVHLCWQLGEERVRFFHEPGGTCEERHEIAQASAMSK